MFLVPELFQRVYTDEEINQVAEWIQGLTFDQLCFLKESYEAFVIMRAHEAGSNDHVH